MAFHNEKEQLFLETDVSNISLGISLLQVRDRMWHLRDEASNIAAL